MADDYTKAYPLHWPEGRPRTASHKREDSRFKTTFAKGRDNLVTELDRLNARSAILSTNIELRLDGLPYANKKQPEDPGVAVYFEYKGQRMCFACDKYRKVDDNIHAIAKTIEALRGIARWGTGDMMERAFTGFQALPDHGTDQPWRSVLNCHGINDLNFIEKEYRRLRSKHHPDKGGSSVMFQQIQDAWENAQEELAH